MLSCVISLVRRELCGVGEKMGVGRILVGLLVEEWRCEWVEIAVQVIVEEFFSGSEFSVVVSCFQVE